ncbi:MAG TPA: cytochrome b/b6 domain-containing protein, partial [Propionibacteriaceae bacterium]|nr:cytochrome b/b6 domain-containing protein [Propionibacteriaceae bacterium]
SNADMGTSCSVLLRSFPHDDAMMDGATRLHITRSGFGRSVIQAGAAQRAKHETGTTLLHVLLGLSIMLLGLLRVVWRARTPLPPWAEHLGPGERRLESLLEKALLTLLFVVPGTGLLLVAGSTDWLFVHVTAQVVFLGVIALHVGLVLKHTVVRRHRHLGRML